MLQHGFLLNSYTSFTRVYIVTVAVQDILLPMDILLNTEIKNCNAGLSVVFKPVHFASDFLILTRRVDMIMSK